jgi:hypothetical protein
MCIRLQGEIRQGAADSRSTSPLALLLPPRSSERKLTANAHKIVHVPCDRVRPAIANLSRYYRSDLRRNGKSTICRITQTILPRTATDKALTSRGTVGTRLRPEWFTKAQIYY